MRNQHDFMETKFYLPLYTPGKHCASNTNQKILIADLRLEKSFLAVYECKEGNILPTLEQEMVSSDFNSLSDLIKQFIKENTISGINTISIAVPGPVISGVCKTDNLPWKVLDQEVLKSELNVSKLYLINDLEATAYSLMEFEKSKLEFLHKTDHIVHGNVAILAPGNGLGEAGLFWDGAALRPFATEGGHTEFSPRTDFEVEFYLFLKKITGIVTWENVLSKAGLYNIYRFLRDVGRHKEDDDMKNRIPNENFLDLISEFGKDKKCRLVNLTIEMYSEFLAREANNLALKLKTTGGLIITGDIPSALFDLIDKEKFYKEFRISDRMDHLLEDIPLYLIRNDKGILEGAGFYGAFIEE